MNILIAGDFCQRFRVDEAVKNKKYNTLFDSVRPIIKSVDYSIVNFEFPIVINPNDASPIHKCGPNLEGSIEAIEALQYAGFNCCTLANNHILDQGEECCIRTKMELEKSGIDTVGAGINTTEANKILYKSISGEVLAIINCCEHEFSIATMSSAGANPINPISQYHSIAEAKQHANYVVVIVHGGHEHYQLPSPQMQELYRYYIDLGADIVINHHQHCFSGYEIYKNRPIFYGLGNFCFDEPGMVGRAWNEGFMLLLQLKKNVTPSFLIYPYTQCDVQVGVHCTNDTSNFYKKIEELNTIISDRDSLHNAFRNYVNTRADIELLLHQPYHGRITKKLHKMRLLPSLVTRDKWIKLLNYIETESHREVQIEAIKINNEK